ncbi:hypothetical protein BV98_003799 [Sphingobium herbicidovorans NBRC 16415]|uniref:Calpastatin n=1 Tax=Sphingobium herbicidovorans (strain ATCC 700291 / DSM 11019 / CCUG 56400 / KCTC 2939 / LMG 18315 / NBRC 16415 / MH) TaxID=1219045 RepID=A0A086P4T1_SPHHM|nr:DUF1810 domain-containing protein [Sphingobium herbicidovorans]KFG88399.1 hypothetical protein BV98_003799 [Sphingobium herbicidovorans NBRC 16415]
MRSDATLARFVEAQAGSYAAALSEIRRGAKRSHWIWFIFPQLRGLGQSQTAHYYGIASIEEAHAYLAHELLGFRYRECVGALQQLHTSDPVVVFGSIDAMKLRSSLTLFEAAAPEPLFASSLDRWFGGVRDPATQHVLAL